MMQALSYVFTICFVAAVLFLIVDKFEPDRRYANVLKLLILAVGAAANRKTVVALSAGIHRGAARTATEDRSGYALRHFWTRLAFRNRKYFMTNLPSRPGSGPPQARHVISRSADFWSTSTSTI